MGWIVDKVVRVCAGKGSNVAVASGVYELQIREWNDLLGMDGARVSRVVDVDAIEIGGLGGS